MTMTTAMGRSRVRTRASFTERDLVQATGGHVVISSRDPSVCRSVTTDSRLVQSGDWFLPIKGGRNFVSDAIERGCEGIILEAGDHKEREREKIEEQSNSVALLVTDGQTEGVKGLQNLARFVRTKFKGNVVAITGSCGKTTTRSMVSHLLFIENQNWPPLTPVFQNSLFFFSFFSPSFPSPFLRYLTC